MAIRQQVIHPIGMRQDDMINSTSENSSQYAVDVKNLRFNTINDLTTGVWTTEKGNVNVELHIVDGLTKDKYRTLNTIIHKIDCETIVGSAVINDQWILFGILETSTYRHDFILKLWYDNNLLMVDLLYYGNLNFSAEHPLETMPYYENEAIQKVYWTDNLNQPRFINVVNVKNWNNHDDQFDFVKKVSLDEDVYCWKESGRNGIWNAGTVKYALTYFNKYGQESNIVWTSTLLYPTVGERGCDSEEISGDLMHVMVHVTNDKMLSSWDCLRLYSIYRSSEGAKPIVKVVEDRPLLNPETNKYDRYYHFQDNNTTGTIVDSDRLMFVGGREICCETFNQKDGTMFMGNITLKKRSIEQILAEYGIKTQEWFVNATVTYDSHGDITDVVLDPTTVGFTNDGYGKDIVIYNSNLYSGGVYLWNNQLNYKIPVYGSITSGSGVQVYKQINPTIFKYNEWYRFGIQFQDELGNWSEVHHLIDLKNNILPANIFSTNPGITTTGVFRYVLPSDIKQILYNEGYRKARLVYCPPTNGNRRVISQGLLSSTISNNKWKKDHCPDCFHSYFHRSEDPFEDEILSFIPTYKLFSAKHPSETMTFENSYYLANDPYNHYYSSANSRGYMISLNRAEHYGGGNDPTEFAYLADLYGNINWDYYSDVEGEPATWHGKTFIGWLEYLFDDLNESVFKLYDKVIELSSPDVEFDDSVRTLDLTGTKLRKVGTITQRSRTGYCYLDFESQAMDFVGNKGKGPVKLYELNKSYTDTAYGFNGFRNRRLLYWNDIDVYNANSVPDKYEEETSNGLREQFNYLTYDYYIHPFHRKYLNNYMGDLTLDIYRKGKDPEYNVTESSIIKEKTFAYRHFGFNTVYNSNPVQLDKKDIQVFDSLGDTTLRLKTNDTDGSYINYCGNMNTYAPLCNYKDIYDILYSTADDIFNHINGNEIILVSNRTGDNTIQEPIVFKYPADENDENYTHFHIANPFFAILGNVAPNSNNSQVCDIKNWLIQPTFETPIFKYQGLNIYTEDAFYVNVETNWGDAFRNNWTADDYASIFTGVGWIASIYNTLGEADRDYTEDFAPIQRSYIRPWDWLTELGETFVNLIFGNIASIIADIVKWTNSPDWENTAYTLNVYKGAYPLPVVIKNELRDRAKLGTYKLSMPEYYVNDSALQDDDYLNAIIRICWDGECTTHDASHIADNLKLYSFMRSLWPVGVSSDLVPFSYKTTPRFVASVTNSFRDTLNLGEVYRIIGNLEDTTSPEYHDYSISHQDKSFGSTLLSAYIPCSSTVSLNNDSNEDIVLIHNEGDHYFMRYDNLHTYPYEDPSINGIVEIISYMVETRVNLDGRCDKNRGLDDNTIVRNNNFNIINKAYTQQDNYFTYFCIDDLSKQLDTFKSTITWSKTKVNGELVDNWTNVTMVNTDDANGSYGAITRIENINNNLLMFQEHSIAQIGFNEKTAISTANGVPLEMANSDKFTGFNYISTEFGCQNKWSINNNHLGLMFIDDSINGLLGYTSEGVNQITKKVGFDSFMINELKDADKTWTPENFNNFITFYDKISKDLYFLNNNKCLTFNETSSTFTSFYDYYGISAMANISNHFLMWGGVRGAEYETVTEIINPVDISNDISANLVTTVKCGPNLTTTSIDRRTDIHTNFAYEPGVGFYNISNSIMEYQCTEDQIKRGIIIIPFYNEGYKVGANQVNFNVVIDLLFKNNEWLRVHLNYDVSRTTGGMKNATIINSTYEGSDNVINAITNENFNCTIHCQKNYHLLFIGNNIDENLDPVEMRDGTTLFDSFVDGTFEYDSDNVYCVMNIYDMNKHLNQALSGYDLYGSNDIWYNEPLEQDEGNYTNFWFYRLDNGNLQVSIKAVDSYYKAEMQFVKPNHPSEPTVIVDTRTINSGIWATRENEEYSKFFNEYKPYWITLMSDGGKDFRLFDKVFNLVEYKADLFDENTLVDNYGINAYLFTDIAAWNGYQFYKEFDILPKEDINALYPFVRNLDDRYEWQSERKFNVWRTIMPRATYKVDNEYVTSRDRIRNPFTFIKLVNNHPEFNKQPEGIGSHRMVLHDFTVSFDVR